MADIPFASSMLFGTVVGVASGFAAAIGSSLYYHIKEHIREDCYRDKICGSEFYKELQKNPAEHGFAGPEELKEYITWLSRQPYPRLEDPKAVLSIYPLTDFREKR